MTTQEEIGIALDDVCFAYGAGTVAMNFNVRIPRGELVALMGASGSGKSTLFSLICGFEKPASGRIFVGNRDVTDALPAQRPVSMVFQEHNLFAHLTVADNVALGLSPVLKLNGDQKLARDEALEVTGLSGLGARLPGQLSTGQRQRVALARILLRERPVLLLDEAFAALGPALRSEMLDLVHALHVRNELTTIMITHFPEDARRIADSVLFITDGKNRPMMSTATALDPQNPDKALRAYFQGGHDHQLE